MWAPISTTASNSTSIPPLLPLLPFFSAIETLRYRDMSDILQSYLEGKIVSYPRIDCISLLTKHRQDFEGQKLVEQLSRNVLLIATVSVEMLPVNSSPEPFVVGRCFYRRIRCAVAASVVWRVRSVRGWAQSSE